jgi:hypothetical protein
VKTRCLAATSAMQAMERHERHRVTPQIAPAGGARHPWGPADLSNRCEGAGGRSSQPGAAFTAAINSSNATRLSTRLML